MAKRSKGSALLLVVAGMVILFIVGAILIMSTKERDLAAHNLVYEKACHEIALSAANVTLLAFRRSLIMADHWDPSKQKAAKDMLGFLLRDNKSLYKALEGLHNDGDYQNDELEKLLGTNFLSPVKEGVLPFYPGASVKVGLHLIPSPLYERIDFTEDYFDPFERNFTVTVVAEATWDRSIRTVTLTKEARFNSLLPPATGKFAFICNQPTSDHFNSRRCDATGLSPLSDKPEPLWRIFANENTKEINDELKKKASSESFSLFTTASNWRAEVGDLSLDTLQEEFKDEGFIYFGPNLDDEQAVLMLPAGDDDHLLSNIHCPANERHKARVTPSQPNRFTTLGGMSSKTFAQALFSGIHDKTLSTGYFGSSLQHDRSTRLMLFGAPEHPSPTLVLGPAVSGCARIAGLAIDRDKTETDEIEQKSCSGLDLPQRETIDPFFINANENDYSAAICRETSTPLELTPLRPFCSPSLIGAAIAATPPEEPVRTGLLENLNFHVDSNNDGQLDTTVSSEAPFQPIAIPLDTYSYGKLFDNWDEYCRFASSGKENFSFNLLAKTMKMLPSDSFSALWENRQQDAPALVGSQPQRLPSTGVLNEDKFTLSFTDKLHKKAKSKPLFDNERDKDRNLSDLPILEMMKARAIITMSGKEFRERMLSGTDKDSKRQLDLRGCTINMAFDLVLEPYQKRRGPLTITVRGRYDVANHMRPDVTTGNKNGFWLDGGGAIVASSISFCDTIIQNEDGDETTPLILSGGTVAMRVPFHVDGLITGRNVAVSEPRHTQPHDAPPQSVNGAVHMNTSRALLSPYSLDITYDKRYDPTKETMVRHYRGFVSDAVYNWHYGRDSFSECWKRVRDTWNEKEAIKAEEEKE